MKTIKLICVLAAGAIAFAACDKTGSEPVPDEPETDWDPQAGWAIPDPEGETEEFTAPEPPFKYSIIYEYDKSDFCNPERGSYNPLEYHFRTAEHPTTNGIPSVYPVSRLKSARGSNCTLHYLGVYLCDYLDCDIPEEALAVLRQHFENEREAGVKVVLRHAYSWNTDWDGDGDEYDEDLDKQNPPKEWILRHIEQLAPIWNEYKDVIYIIQSGFIGTYGEWHHVAHDIDEDDRADIIKSILDKMPSDRMLAMRTPYQKRAVLERVLGHEITLNDTITSETAYDGSYASRIAIHSDCIFANATDGGTFSTAIDKRYMRSEGRYVPHGGESCFVGDYTYCACAYSNDHMRKLHWSYLSNHYAIAQYWKDEGCGDMDRRVGYRFVLNGSAFYGKFSAGSEFLMKLCLTNFGYASLMNGRKIELVIANSNDPEEKYVFVSEKDPRDWKGCHNYEYDEKITLPETLKAGEEYTLYLNLPDVSPELHDNPAFSVRVANKSVWDETTGYNRIAAFKAE